MKRLVCIAMLLFSQQIFAQNVGLNPEDISKLQYVYDVVINDEGNKIAYTVVKQADPTKENAAASRKLWLYDLEGEVAIPFISQGSVSGIAFRPGHSSITFLSRRDGAGTTGLYEIPLLGGEATLIVEHETSISSYEWSADGKQVVYLAKEKVSKNSMLPYEPIIYEENLPLRHAFVVTPGSDAKQIAVDGYCYEAHWSPDGTTLGISAAPTALVDDSYTSQAIYLVNVAANTVTGKVDHAGKLGSFSWSTDGKHISFIGGADIHDPIDGRLFVVASTGGTPKQLAADFEGKFEQAEWLGDGKLEVIVSEGVFTSFGTINADGKKFQKSINKGSISFDRFSSAQNGTVAMVGSTAAHPDELFVFDGKKTRRLTTSNDWLSEKAMGKQEVLTYKAKDGLEIEGLVILPVDYEDGKRYPLITVVHGGPEAHYDHGWLTAYSMPGQMAAANGYMVFYPNYRGSTGRGEVYAKSSQGDPGGLEFDDIIDGIDHLIDAGMVDKSKVGVTGGSYGGYATAWMSTRHTERFAAGVMFVGISNNLSKWGTSDIPEEMFLVHSRKRIWDDYEFFLKRSPIYYADQAQTPLLILAGAGDTRVDPGQSKELYRHVKTRTDTPVRLVLYPGEGHGNRKATARFDYSLRMMRWFNRYLQQDEAEIPETELEME